jgi:hypothetical protein
VSTSIGYGIFWYEQTSSSAYSKAYTSCHYFIGVFGVSLAMAVFARSLNTSHESWFADAKLKQQLDAAVAKSAQRSSMMVKCQLFLRYYWPKVHVHVLLVVWTSLGVLWGATSVQTWSVLDTWLFCMTAMTKGGLVSLPSSGVHQWDYAFFSLYIVVGAPLMAISCAISAHAIANFGKTQRLESKLNAPMTEDELVMMQHLGVEDDDGYIDEAEFTILVLVRIGALNPDLIGVLFDRFDEIDRDGTGNVSYWALQSRQSFFGNSMMAMPMSFMGPVKGSALIKKLRLDSMGGVGVGVRR